MYHVGLGPALLHSNQTMPGDGRAGALCFPSSRSSRNVRHEGSSHFTPRAPFGGILKLSLSDTPFLSALNYGSYRSKSSAL